MEPTLAGFLSFVRGVMGITTAQLPDAAPVIAMAYGVALDIVNPDLGLASSRIYPLAVYNLAGSNLLAYAPDPQDAPPVQGSEPPMAFFAFTRKQFNINGFTSGVIQSASDETTSQSMVVQEAAKNFTLMDLQNLKDPYGRRYLEFAQQSGSLWGLT